MNADLFPKRLRELRVAAKLTQQELADKAGLKLGAVRDIEQGLNGPTWKTVLALCAALGVDCTVFTQEPQPGPAPERGRPRKSPEEAEAPPKRGRPRKPRE